MLKTVTATRYVTPLREGGSLPAIVEVDNGSQYVMKFAGAGQGIKALIAEVLAGEMARVLGLRVPEIAFINLPATVGRSEPDPEIQDLLRASVGLNLGLAYLPQAAAFNILLEPQPDTLLASKIVWLDAFITNVDRTPRNVNMLTWHNELWLIDHGAALYFHHSWDDYLARSQTPFAFIKEHTLLPLATRLTEADHTAQASLTPEVIRQIVALIPEPWLDEPTFASPTEQRQAYIAYFLHRLEAAPIFVEEANRARDKLV